MKFTEAFDVPALLTDLENMQHIPADIGKLYDCEVYKCDFDGVYLSMEYKTTENTYISQRLVFDRNWDKIQSLRSKFGVNKFEEWVGKTCKVFYKNELNVVVL